MIRLSFFSKNKNPDFFNAQTVLLESNSLKTILYLFSTIFRNCVEIVGQVFFHTFVVWNCMISIFGLWRLSLVGWRFLLKPCSREITTCSKFYTKKEVAFDLKNDIVF